MVGFLTSVNQISQDTKAILRAMGFGDFDPVSISAASHGARLAVTGMLRRVEEIVAPRVQDAQTLDEGFKDSVAALAQISLAFVDAAEDGALTELEATVLYPELLSTILLMQERLLQAGEIQTDLLIQYAIPAVEVGFVAGDWGL